ncbi:MAG TPA: type II toxin-antitoxin system VapC family toxin [Thermodesulfovibrionales bacterium]|nr:type II toxin-antitoxin system VapC family toxin [Thermodesulfovibrionales bacterium]
MTPPSLKSLLHRHRVVYLDTSIFIYFVEQHPRYHKMCCPIFEDIEAGRIKALTSTLTLLEILVQPYRLKKEDLVLKFYSLLVTYPQLSWIDMTLAVADQAAGLRAKYGLRTPDAIQMASALSHGAGAFICNDRAFERIEGIECLIIDDYI